MIATVLKTLYVLRRYRTVGAPLQRWVIILLLLAALLMAIDLLPGGPIGGLLGAVADRWRCWPANVWQPAASTSTSGLSSAGQPAARRRAASARPRS
jgi:hypothetical protein